MAGRGRWLPPVTLGCEFYTWGLWARQEVEYAVDLAQNCTENTYRYLSPLNSDYRRMASFVKS